MIDTENKKIDAYWESISKIEERLWGMYDEQWIMEENGASEKETEAQWAKISALEA